ncbi:MAG TPA: HEAT repeat domain-containing protein [Acidobacteriaceae bacterium]|nr:HEAT repeat domain-containing protein [Acidobacteriaceae bacterium]
MNCESAQQNIVLAQYGELPDDLQHQLEQHLGLCEECRREWNAMLALSEELAQHPLAEPSPNLLAASRMRLDEALDAMPPKSVTHRFWGNAFRWMGYVQGAPALTVLLIGVGFLGGNIIARYQAAHVPPPPRTVATTNASQSAIANVLDIKQTPDPQIVQVKYNSLVPETMQGSLNDPQIRQLVMLATKMSANPEVHKDAVSLLVNQCRATAGCSDDGSNGDAYRGTLLASLHYDKDPQVRLNALQGLQPYVSQSESVRNAVLDALMNDQSSDVRSAAISMLEPVQADSSVRRVLRSVSTQDSSAAIRNASFQALQGSADIE